MNKPQKEYDQINGLKDLSKKVEILERQMKEIKEKELKQIDKLKNLEKQTKGIKEELLKELKAEIDYAIYLSTLSPRK